MPIKTHTCLTLVCNVCGHTFSPDDYDVHFPDLAAARSSAADLGWVVTADTIVICHTQDGEHQKCLDALMPPEPVMQVPGQLGLDGTEAS